MQQSQLNFENWQNSKKILMTRVFENKFLRIVTNESLTAVKLCKDCFIEAVVQRSSVKKGVLRNFSKFSGKHLC